MKNIKARHDVFYFPTRKDARHYALDIGLRDDRIIEYGLGFAVQIKIAGRYAGPTVENEILGYQGA